MLKRISIVSTLLPIILGLGVVPVMAQTSTSTVKNTTGSAVNVSCIQNAISVRDGAIGSAVGALGTAWQAALQNRSTALQAAWSVTVRKDRRQAINAAWQAFNGSMKTARGNYKTAQHTAWTQFYSARKVCGGNVAADDRMTEGADNR